MMSILSMAMSGRMTGNIEQTGPLPPGLPRLACTSQILSGISIRIPFPGNLFRDLIIKRRISMVVSSSGQL
jgi:hypothetical protein